MWTHVDMAFLSRFAMWMSTERVYTCLLRTSRGFGMGDNVKESLM
jgi:hypothetical protein